MQLIALCCFYVLIQYMHHYKLQICTYSIQKLSLCCVFLGLFYFLGSIVNFSQEADVHFKYIQVKSMML